MTSHKTLSSVGTFEFIEKKSRFNAVAAPVGSEEDARAFIADIRNKNKTASHNVYAYIIGDNQSCMRFSDDGEPSGTGGMPALGVLRSTGVINAVVVITRYYGGIMLGAGGLVRAYSAAAAGAVTAAGIITRKPYVECIASADYAFCDKIKYELETAGFNLTNIVYMTDVTFELSVLPERMSELETIFRDCTSGKAVIFYGDTVFM